MKRLTVAIFAILLFACHQNNSEQKTADVPGDQVAVENNSYTADSAAADGSGTPAGPGGSLGNPAPPQYDWTRKIVKTATLELELNDYRGFNNSLHGALAQYGAYIAHEMQTETSSAISNEVSIKVPADRFESLVNYLVADPKNKVLQKEIGTQDVTMEYVDTRARIETKKQLRAKYYELLKQAKKMDEILQVQQEINEITVDIEAAAGRIEYLGHQSVYSTINLSYRQYFNGAVPDSHPGFFARLIEGLKTGAHNAGNLVVAAAYIWPLVMVALVVFWVIRRSGVLRVKP
ncbi:MAG TPA: DUF4349 domain-containing protein [Chitinophagaceae bacterium]